MAIPFGSRHLPHFAPPPVEVEELEEGEGQRMVGYDRGLYEERRRVEMPDVLLDEIKE